MQKRMCLGLISLKTNLKRYCNQNQPLKVKIAVLCKRMPSLSGLSIYSAHLFLPSINEGAFVFGGEFLTLIRFRFVRQNKCACNHKLQTCCQSNGFALLKTCRNSNAHVTMLAWIFFSINVF